MAGLTEPETFYKKATQLYRQWKAKQQDASESDTPAVASKEAVLEKAVSIAFETAEDDARSEIERALAAVNSV